MRARSMPVMSSSRPIGFSMKSSAPALMACTAMGTSALLAIMIAGKLWPFMMQLLEQFEPAHPGR